MPVLAEALITDEVVDNIIVALGEDLAPFNAFLMDAVDGPVLLKENAVGGYLLEKSGTRETPNKVTAQDASIAFQDTAATSAAVTLNTALYWGSAARTYGEALAGIPARTLVPNLVKTMAEDVWDDLVALITAVTFTKEVVEAKANFDGDTAQAMWGALDGANETNFVIERSEFAQLLPNTLENFQTGGQGSTGFGVPGSFYYCSDINDGDASTYGIACHPQAIVGAWGLPAETNAVSTAAQIDETVITDPMTGANFLLSSWIDPNTKTEWMNLSIMAGFAVGDATALVRVSLD